MKKIILIKEMGEKNVYFNDFMFAHKCVQFSSETHKTFAFRGSTEINSLECITGYKYN